MVQISCIICMESYIINFLWGATCLPFRAINFNLDDSNHVFWLWKLEEDIHYLPLQFILEYPFVSKLVHLRCSIHLGVKITHIWFKKPRVSHLHPIHAIFETSVSNSQQTPLWNQSKASHFLRLLHFVHHSLQSLSKSTPPLFYPSLSAKAPSLETRQHNPNEWNNLA